jgi:glyoxylase-like metal-dependent hydrolase (beta-lactamase superfamily II)
VGAVAIGPGVYRIPTAGDYINSFAFVEEDGSVTLVDTGMPWGGRAIRNGLRESGKRPEDVQRVVLTHAHGDHAGSAASLLPTTSARGASVHLDDAEFVDRGSPPPASGVGKILQRLPGFGWKPVPVAESLTDGDVLDVAGGLQVHHTPGHTPGHISLLHPDSGVLITGDAIFNMAGRMTWPVKAFCTSLPLNKRSAAVLADLDYRVAAFTHGPHIDESARETVRGFLRRDGVVE